MFKPLLKTIPSLSGNMKLSCFLEGYNKDSSGIYNCIVQKAKLTAISHKLYDKNIFVNLKNNSFEYDVNRFFSNYSNIFYKTNYNFSKINIPIIDFSDVIDNSNDDFNFGCKRISYNKYDNQLAFFAPIYIEGLDDIKGKYLKIKCKFSKVYKLTKEIKISISNILENNEENYLASYLDRYASKIDDKVIYMSKSYKNMYYGIDLLHGGFIHIEDNISKNLYNKYYTINDFDAIINGGFKRNSIIMKQIIPLCFYFNPDNLLNKYEKSLYSNAEVLISAEWYDENDKALPFYNFSDNYNYYTENIYILNTFNKFVYNNTYKNIMNIQYPAFNESKSENYKFINTIAKNYNRWKLKYSDDNYPYIINANYAFSYNQNSLYMYKEFPIKYQNILGICNQIGNEYNLLFDLIDIYNEEGNIINKKEIYYNLYNKNYISNFYNLLTVNDGYFLKNNNKTITRKYNNIFENENIWGNVVDNKIYYKGILYDFNKLYSKYTSIPKIDKFTVLVNPLVENKSISFTEFKITYFTTKNILDLKSDYTYNYINEIYTYSNKYNNIENKYDVNNGLFNYLENYNYKNIYSYDFQYSYYDYILNNQTVVKNKKGEYVDINSYLFKTNYTSDKYINDNAVAINILHYDNPNNLYIDINELLLVIEIMNIQNNNNDYNGLYDYLFNIYNDKLIDNYKIINISYVNNIISEIYSLINGEDFYNLTYKFNDSNIIYREHKFLENENIYWALDRIYFSIYPNKTKYHLLSDIHLLKDKDFNDEITLYYQTQFISITDLQNIFKDINIDINIDNNIIQYLNLYYVINGLYNYRDKIIYTDLSFKLLTNLDRNYYNYNIYSNTSTNPISYKTGKDCCDLIYVDSYNLDNVFKKYNINIGYDKSNNLAKIIKVKNCYCKFLNIDHINKYFEKLYLDEFLNVPKDENENQINIIDTIYIKINLFNNIILDNDNLNNLNLISNTIEYIPISNFFDNDSIDLNIILNYINYNDNGYFYFNDSYFKDNKNLIQNNKYYIKNFEICFKKDMFLLNSDLYELILQLNEKHNYKDLYLYRLSSNKDYCFEYLYNNIKIPEFLEKENNNANDLYNYIKFNKDNNIELNPYFNSIYDENKNNTKIYEDYIINNIYVSNSKFKHHYIDLNNSIQNIILNSYISNNIDIDYLCYIPINENGKDIYENYRYSIYKNNENYFVNSYEFIDKYIDKEITYSNIYYKYNPNINRNTNARDIIKYLYTTYDNSSIIENYRNEIYAMENGIGEYANLTPDMRKSYFGVLKDFDTCLPTFSFYNKKLSIYYNRGYRTDLNDYKSIIGHSEYSINKDLTYQYIKLLENNGNSEEFFNNLDPDIDNYEVTSAYILNNVKQQLDHFEKIEFNDVFYVINNGNNDDKTNKITKIGNILSIDNSKYYDCRSYYVDFDDHSRNYNHTQYYIEYLDDHHTTINTKYKQYIYEYIDYNLNNLIDKYNSQFNDYDNLITYNNGETTYGFYLLHTEFDNTCNTLNLVNENLNNVNVITYINNHTFNDFAYYYPSTYLTKYYHNIIPYIHSNNIVKDMLDNVNTIIKPDNYSLVNIYNQFENKDLNRNTYSYTIFINKKNNIIELLRYFDNIVPYIYKTNNVNSYNLYYKDTDNYIEHNLYINNISYIMYLNEQNIYSSKKISYFGNDNNINEFIPYEYKNYNNNKYYNLSTHINIKYNISKYDSFKYNNNLTELENNKILNENLLTEKQIIEIENSDKVFKIFKQYVQENFAMDNLSETYILFLYKKYQLKYSTILKYIFSDNLKYYTLTIKFNLL